VQTWTSAIERLGRKCVNVITRKGAFRFNSPARFTGVKVTLVVFVAEKVRIVDAKVKPVLQQAVFCHA
jgi:hypothetical protein